MAPAADYCHDFHGSEVPHVPIFPLMAKGHTVPLLDLACLLRHRGLAAVTFLTTPGNASFVRASLAGDDAASVVELPFPAGHAPAGGESAEGVTSTSSFAAFAEATSPLRPRLEQVLAAMRPPVDLLVADGFLYWAHASAAALGVPTVSFLGTSAFAHAVREACVRDKLGASAQRDDDADASTGMYTVPEFPHLQFSLADLVPPPLPLMELDAKMAAGVAAGHGLIMNTFRDLVDRYVEHWNRHIGPRAWPIGPLCLARQSSSSSRWVSRSVSKVGERW
nr:UDP-glycosyltransferase 90A1-like [Setaria viridis]